MEERPRLNKEEEMRRKMQQDAEMQSAIIQRKWDMFNRLRTESNIGKRYYEASFNNLIKEQVNEKGINTICDYIKSDKYIKNGQGLYLFGSYGTGKTYLASCIMNHLMYNGVPCKINTLDNIKNEIMSSGYVQGGSERVVNAYSYIKLLVLDDIGTEQFTYNGQANAMQSQIFSIINNRYKNMLPTIYTSNYSLEELQKKGLDTKITDRIFETTVAFIEIKGANKRI